MAFSVEEIARCKAYLGPALEYAGGTHTIDDVFDLIACEKAQLWVGKEAAVVTEVLQHPRKKVCNFFLAGGNLDEILLMLPFMEKWAELQGCDAMSVHGRPGWKKVLIGYQPQAVALVKELQNGQRRQR